MPCKCYLPPYTTEDPDLCEVLGGECVRLNEIRPHFEQEPISSPGQGCGCPPPVQRRMEIPFELCPDFEEWLGNRYIWELSDDD